MQTKEEMLDEALDIAEATMDILESAPRFSGRDLIIVGALGGMVGGVAAYYICKKKMETKYEQISKAEIAQAKEFYSALNKKGDYETPENTIKHLNPKKSEDVDAGPAVEALKSYQGQGEDDPEEEPVSLYLQEPVEDSSWDYEEEMKSRTPEKPYIIHEDEFMNGEEGFTQTTLTYYEGDATLADERDQEIPFADPIVGEENLQHFGHGTQDPRTVFIRNERLSTDFEVVLSDGKYAHEVLGFQHSYHSHRKHDKRDQRRKFRGEDE